MLESAQSQILSETNQVRSQLAVTTQLTKDQATQIIDLERRLMQTSELSKTSNQRQALLEQQLRDLRLTSEKHQLSMQGQAETFTKQNEKINQLETTNTLLQEEMNSLKTDNECLALACQQEKELAQDLQQQLDQLRDQHRIEKESAQNEIELLQNQLNETNLSQQAYVTLKNSFTEIEKRCVKHQKSEIEVKRQLSVYKTFVVSPSLIICFIILTFLF
jgi:chromosome segregation ATPase